MNRLKTQVLPGESAAIHGKLDEILCGGDTAEILLVLWLLLDLRPFSRHKHRKKKGQPQTAALKKPTRNGRASDAFALAQPFVGPPKSAKKMKGGRFSTALQGN